MNTASTASVDEINSLFPLYNTPGLSMSRGDLCLLICDSDISHWLRIVRW